jgi:Na+/H+ antiporter NhaD/arsenite permease-like protein
MSLTTTGLILIACGVLAMLGSALNWRIVTHSGKLFNRLFGDKTARVIYFGVGIFVFVKGIELTIGAHWLPF